MYPLVGRARAKGVLALCLSTGGQSWVLGSLAAGLWGSWVYCLCTGLWGQVLGPLVYRAMSGAALGSGDLKAACLLVGVAVFS